ncbi:MAG: type I DNA topoisomerase [Saprospiraceae bacterium]|nr:type I DNA topoisomerase [Saprospiraceae bacterium]MBK7737157.1 type I DNA topoisomerase [Saprospiraceae bacterium]
MASKLLIVESPAKAKTIEKYLGKDFKVKSSYGHIRDLDKGSKGIDINQKFTPNYVVSPEKTKVVKDLKDWAAKVDEIWLATDEDREGEAISWHLCEVLGLNPEKVNRIVFHEITKQAIQKAVKNPRTVDLNLVNAQQARRVLDRLVGFELSEILWRKVRNKLSAGRVQSVAVKLVVDRERSIQEFQSEDYFKIDALFVSADAKNKQQIKAVLNHKFKTAKESRQFLELCSDSNYLVSHVAVKPTKRNPAPPFTTSTLQQEASRKLGFGVNRTMSNAQKLYELGWITYMRTDSTNLSETALNEMAVEIEKQFGKQYVHTRQYKTKNASAQEAHEAIRPTYMDLRNAGEDTDQQKLYELIWKRAMASQMAAAEIEKTEVDIAISKTKDHFFQATGEVLIFDGFLKLYLESSDDEDEENASILPPLKVKDLLNYLNITATQKYTRPPARYTEASLVKKLEELGIGRPSTYAPTISKIMEENRGYVVKESRPGMERAFQVLKLEQKKIIETKESEITGAGKNHLYPTDIGMIVCDYLALHFPDVINYSFTAEIEQEFDEIADGRLNWVKMIDDFYWPFHKNVDVVMEQGERAKGRRDLGIDPATGKKILVQLTRFGPVVQLGDRDEMKEDEKPVFANLKPGQSMETISFEEALELFKLPRDLGKHENQDVTIGSGRFGPYVKFGEQFISIPKNLDPLEISKETAIEIIKQKQKEDAPIGYYKELPVTKGTGRFGPFVKWNGIFVNVPKRINFEKLNLDDVKPLIDAKEVKEANRFILKFDEDKITVENGRWGPYIKYGKKLINFPKKDGQRITADQAAKMTLEDIKSIIQEQIPTAFVKKERKKKAK